MTTDVWVILAWLAIMSGTLVFFQFRGISRAKAMQRKQRRVDSVRCTINVAMADLLERLADEMEQGHRPMPGHDPEVRP